MSARHLRMAATIAVLLPFSARGLASPSRGDEIGSTFPEHFPVIKNFYLGKPVIGFGSDVGPASIRP
ncbi:hypothetical protein [Bradyrhizobium sp.]|uniref:hypothetical protein n=1 Tax=Bradyrhizobium sp. TaxID=376 RepID=UPI003C455F4C